MTMARLLGVLVLLAAFPVAANDALRLRVTPEMSVEPAWITVHASIEPDAANRAIRIVVDSGDFYRSSEVDLDGENAAKTNIFQYRNLPAGQYDVEATLIGVNGHERAVARRVVMVMP